MFYAFKASLPIGVAIGVASLVVGLAPAMAVDGDVTRLTTTPADETVPRAFPSVSNSGQYVAFESAGEIYLLDTTDNSSLLVSKAPGGTAANGSSYGAAVSANGRYVAYTSYASNLTADSVGQTERQVFRYAIGNGKTIRVSRTPSGGLPRQFAADASISANGRFISYLSYGGNVVPGDDNEHADVFRYDAVMNTTIKVSETLSGAAPDRNSSGGVISADGMFVAYVTGATNMGPSDTNGSVDTYLYDVAADTTTLASHGAAGTAVGKTEPTGVSNGGTIVAMSSRSPRLAAQDTDKDYDAFVYRARTDSVALVNPSAAVAISDGISADGRYALYEEWPTAADTDTHVFVLDRTANEVAAISGADDAGAASVSADGRHAVYLSRADGAASFELFLWTRTSPA